MNKGKGKLLKVYCDESRTNTDRFMVYGGIMFSEKFREGFESLISKYRNDICWKCEFKWERINKRTYDLCKGFVDLYFNNQNSVYYKALVIDRKFIDKSWDDYETRFYKWYYYLLCYSFGKYVNHNNKFVIVLDNRETKYKLSNLLKILNFGMCKAHSCAPNRIRSLEVDDSKKNQFIQIADVISGAIGYELNNYHQKNGASIYKKGMMSYILRKSGVTTFCINTPPSKHSFSVWHFKFNKKKTP